jgi:hypothetical protein
MKYSSKGDMHILWPIAQNGDTCLTSREKNSCVDLKCVWERSGFELLAPIVSNKNLEVMTQTTKAQHFE